MDKLTIIRKLCRQWASRHRVSKRQLQSLLGKLLYISKCVRYARVFMGRMLNTYRKHHNRSVVYLDQDFHRDLSWFNQFLYTFNGRVFVNKVEEFTVYVDASFMGIGGCFNDNVYTHSIPNTFVFGSIVHLELINVLVAIRLWREHFKNSVIKVYCDNGAVVAALNNFRIRDQLILTIVRNIWLELASFNIDLITMHIPGVSNTYADILSRWQVRDRFNPAHVELLTNRCNWYKTDNSLFELDMHI